LGGRDDRLDPLAGNGCIFQLHVHCVSYHSGDYRIERLVRNITVLHAVQIRIYTTYYKYIHILILISMQGVPGGMCQTSGGCSLW
jgi:hypothetical protein